jgi:hypothetical protein
MAGALPLVALLSLGATDLDKPREPSGLVGALVPDRGQFLVGVLETTHALNGLKAELSLATSVGLGAGFDVGAAVDHTLAPLVGPGSMTAVHLTGRKVLIDSGPNPDIVRWRTALTLDVSAAWFDAPPAQEGEADPRQWSGLRNYNVELGFVLGSGRSVGWFMKSTVLVSLDTQPASPGPLEGAAAPFTFGLSGTLEGGMAINYGCLHATTGVPAAGERPPRGPARRPGDFLRRRHRLQNVSKS